MAMSPNKLSYLIMDYVDGRRLVDTQVQRSRQTFDKIGALLWQAYNEFEEAPNAVWSETDAILMDVVVFTSIKSYVWDHWFDKSLDNGPFILTHRALRLGNILINAKGNIVTVFD
ncbi:hypothetical protein MKZ38_005593 [Zalerion maritima]|uniref:Uncharacterized protein n=1 Tax=Zalerion maritima TaxID=339359 RepID=A0AAD5RJW2_9PEZI|nr:hypothetical protein MKZ38_005593 [Zalerion maritima]